MTQDLNDFQKAEKFAEAAGNPDMSLQHQEQFARLAQAHALLDIARSLRVLTRRSSR